VQSAREEACSRLGACPGKDHSLLQRKKPVISRSLSVELPRQQDGTCHTSLAGETCYDRVLYAMENGLPGYPANLTFDKMPLFEALQAIIHLYHFYSHACAWLPCEPPVGMPVQYEGCHALSREECCGRRDGRFFWFHQPCVVVEDTTWPVRDVGIECQPLGWVAGGTEWRGKYVADSGAGASATLASLPLLGPGLPPPHAGQLLRSPGWKDPVVWPPLRPRQQCHGASPRHWLALPTGGLGITGHAL